MSDSREKAAALRLRIAAVERQGNLQAHPAGLPLALGHAGIDAALGGGVTRGRLHEIFAETSDDAGSAAGFAAMLAALAMRQAASAGGVTTIWLREQAAQARSGCLHAPGLAELGLDPGRMILGVLDDPTALLRVAGDVVRCAGVDVAVVELWRSPRVLDLTATRRLAVAAEQSGVTVLMLRAEAEPTPSAAQTRWSVASASAAPLEADAPGFPTLDLHLLRQRAGPSGLGWRVEWNRDQGQFREPALPGAVVPLSQRRSLAAGSAG